MERKVEIFHEIKSNQKLACEFTNHVTAFQKMAEGITSAVLNGYSSFLRKKRSVGRRKRFCYSYGDPSHDKPSCPSKERGKKCFKYNKFGHISTSCCDTEERLRQELSLANDRHNELTELISKFEQKFRKYLEDVELMLASFEKTKKENDQLQATVSELKEECAKLRVVNEKNGRSTKTDTEFQTDVSRLEKKLNFSNDEENIKTFVRIKPSENPECFNWDCDSTERVLILFSEDGTSNDRYFFGHVLSPIDDNESISN